MRQIRSRDTKPELIVRSLLHRLGYRFRLHRSDLPGRPDIVLPKLRKVIFVHGCFWHQHRRCIDGRLPKSRRSYWIPKLARNVARDKSNRQKLGKMGWKSLVIWDCATATLDELQAVLNRFLTSQVNMANKTCSRQFGGARKRALARLRKGLDLNWKRPTSRDELHVRKVRKSPDSR